MKPVKYTTVSIGDIVICINTCLIYSSTYSKNTRFRVESKSNSNTDNIRIRELVPFGKEEWIDVGSDVRKNKPRLRFSYENEKKGRTL